MLDKSSLLTVHQFSEMTGVPDSTLRYYDKLGLLSPVDRGRNQYRFYSPHQITSLNFITVLSELGVPLAQIGTLTKNRTPENVLEILMERERELDLELKKLQSTYALIHTFQQNIMYGEHASTSETKISHKEETPIVLGGKNDWQKNPEFHFHFAQFCKFAMQKKYNLHYPVGGVFDSFDSFHENPTKPDHFFSADPNGGDRLPGGKYVMCYEKGSFNKLGTASKKIMDFSKKERITLNGPVYVMYLLDEVTTMDESDYLAQILAKV